MSGAMWPRSSRERIESGPDGAQRARMWAALASQTAAEVPVAASKPALASGKSSLLKLGALLAIMGAIGGFWASRGTREQAPVKPATNVVESYAVSPSAPAAPAAPPTVPTVQAVEERARVFSAKLGKAVRAQVPAREASAEGAPQQSMGASDPAAELALLMRARRVLLTTPLRTLELTEEHARDYPHGAFAEEREVLAIEAMVRADQREQAARVRGASRGPSRAPHTSTISRSWCRRVPSGARANSSERSEQDGGAQPKAMPSLPPAFTVSQAVGQNSMRVGALLSS